MAFRLADVKKTVRSRADGERYLHPKLLEGEAACSQVGLLLGYLHTRLGRARREFDPEVLVRFFGDPKVARGLVACLGAVYRWRTQELSDVLDARMLGSLASRGIHSPGELRLYVYDTLNTKGPGYLGPDRSAVLQHLAQRLGLAPAKLDQLVALDAEEHAVLVHTGSAPEPRQVLALYNFRVLDALVRNSVVIDLSDVSSPAAEALELSCMAHAVGFTKAHRQFSLHNQADAFGSFSRHGARLARALYSAAAAHPRLLTAGRARIAASGKPVWYRFDQRTLHGLTAGAGVIRCGPAWPELREDWDRLRLSPAGAPGGTMAGWRLQRTPEPVLTDAGLVLAPYSCLRDGTRVALWPAVSPASSADLLALHAAGLDVVGIVPAEHDDTLPETPPCVSQLSGASGVVAVLAARWGSASMPPGHQALQSLLVEAESRGFVPEAELLSVLGCVSTAELKVRLAALEQARGVFVPGVGLCSPAFAAAMRKGLLRKSRRTPAA